AVARDAVDRPQRPGDRRAGARAANLRAFGAAARRHGGAGGGTGRAAGGDDSGRRSVASRGRDRRDRARLHREAPVRPRGGRDQAIDRLRRGGGRRCRRERRTGGGRDRLRRALARRHPALDRRQPGTPDRGRAAAARREHELSGHADGRAAAQRGRSRRRGAQRDAGCDGAGGRNPGGSGQHDGLLAGSRAGGRRAQRSRAVGAVAARAGRRRGRGGGVARRLAGVRGWLRRAAVVAARVRAGGRGDRARRGAGRAGRPADAVVLCGRAGGGGAAGAGGDTARRSAGRRGDGGVSRKWLFAFACVWLVDCGAPPWQLGRPLDGRPSIPPGHALPTRAQAVAAAEQARVDGRPVLEIDALSKLDAAERMTGSEAGRLAELLVARAAEFRGLRRGIPESADLEAVARLDPAQAALLGPARAAAAKAATDAWAAIGAREEAAAAFRLATAVKGVRPDGWIIPRRTAVPPFEGTPTAPAAVEAYVYGGASLSARLLPLVA